MPKVQTYGAPQVGPVSTTQARFRAADFSHGALGAIGEGLQKLSGTIDNIAQELEAAQVKDADIAFATSLDGIMNDPDAGLLNRSGRQAVDGYQDGLKSIERAAQEAGRGLSPRARKKFEGVAAQRSLAAQSLLQRHVAVENETWKDGQSAARTDIGFADAGNSYLDPAVADQHIATAQSEMTAFAHRKGWSEEQLAAEMLTRTSRTRRLIADRLTDVGPDLGEKYLKTYGPEMRPEDQDAAQDAIRVRRAQILAEQRRAASEAKQAIREQKALVKEQARDVLDMIDDGHEVPPESLDNMAKRMEEYGEPVIAVRLRTAAQVQSVTTELKTWRPDQVQGWINQRRTASQGKPTSVQAAQIDAAEKLLGRMSSGLKEDPLSFAVWAGTARLSPVDLKKPQTAQVRVKTALAVAEKYGIRPTFLTDEETGLLAGQIAKANPQQKAQFAGAIVQAFGRYGRDVLASVSGADPVFAHAAGLSISTSGGKDTAQRIFAGQEAIKDKAVTLPSWDAFNSMTTLGKALAFTPKTRGALLQSARAIYANEAVSHGLDPKVVDADTWEKALNRAAGATYRPDGSRVGGLGTHRGLNIVLPPNVSPDEFSTLLGRLNDSDIKALKAQPRYGNGKAVDIDMLKNAYLFDAGAGKYFVSLDANGTQFLHGPKGHFVLDFSALVPRLRARKPVGVVNTVTEWLGF